MMNQTKQQICLVTGATRGIGRAIAVNLASPDRIVIGTGTTDQGAEDISACFKDLGYAGQGVRLDVTDTKEVQQMAKYISGKFGHVSVLVNNAGISRNNLLMRMRESEWDLVLDTNLKSVYRMSKIFIRGMIRQRFGRIINISSIVGTLGNTGQSHYAATKAGVAAFSKSLALEVASRNITVNVVAPGFIETDMTRELSSDISQNLLSSIPAGRIGTADEVAYAVNFKASLD